MYKHLVQINAAKYTPMNDQLIVTGELRPVAASAFDFRVPKPMGMAMHQLPKKAEGLETIQISPNSVRTRIA